jgi:hypothetical protein
MSAASCADTLAGDDGSASIRLVLLAWVGSLVPAHACAKSGHANHQPAWPEVTVAKVVERRVQDWDEFTGVDTHHEPLNDVIGVVHSVTAKPAGPHHALACSSGFRRLAVTSCCQQQQANSRSDVQSTFTGKAHSPAKVTEPTRV